jgi:lysine-N-methylase
MVNVDRLTYETYQRCEDPELGPRLRELVTINTSSASDDTYARVALSGADCPFLTEGLCGIQTKLGETYLPVTCAAFPRVKNVVDDVLQRSLDLSCPEAARLVLLDPNPMEFDEEEGPPHDARLGKLSVLTTSDGGSGKPYAYFREIRGFVIWLLQYRAWPLWKRLVILGSFCDQLEQLAAAGQNAQIPEMVLELIVARITAEYTSPRFLACYQEFRQGIEWTAESSMDDIGYRYAAAYAQQFAPFLSRHGHMLEHYLVSYVHRTLFPLGPQESTGDPSVHHAAGSMRDQCLRMMVYYAVIQTVLIGMAGYHRAELSPAHAIQVIQSVSKAFEHSVAFRERAVKILDDKGVGTCTGMAILIRN